MNEKIDRLSSTMSKKFTSSHVLLFLGQGIANEDIRNTIAAERWSAVLTTSRDPHFASYFETDAREPWACNSRRKLSGHSLSRKKPIIIQLLGNNETPNDEADFILYGPQGSGTGRLDEAQQMLGAIPPLLSYTNHLVITGLSSNEDATILDRLGRLLQTEVLPERVSFWGMGTALPNNDPYRNWLKAISEKMSFEYYDTSLLDVLKYQQTEAKRSLAYLESPEPEQDVFYCNKHPVSVKQADLLSIRTVGTLLTEETINRIQPLGGDLQRRWFTNFLELSGEEGPQWYGYLPRSDYHVKREYEDPFVRLVLRALRGKLLNGEPIEQKPIILTGHPCSSKSVTLGALAYRVYSEKRSPVLFVTKQGLLGGHISDGISRLDTALQTIQRLSKGAASILVVWDSSSYREIESEARSLLNALRNRRQNVILVCSSYSFGNVSINQTYYTYNKSEKDFVQCVRESDACLTDRSGCLLFKAPREMTEHERFDFQKKANEYSGMPSERISTLMRSLEGGGKPDIFSHYYMLISVLRERLERSLQLEQEVVTRFLQDDKADYLALVARKKATQKSSPMRSAFIKAGLTETQLSELLGEEESERLNTEAKWKDCLVRANAYIAFFSMYKIDIPYDIVYPILTGQSDDNPYGESERELFDILTGDIPWLTYGENDDEVFVFRFRNSLEASIFLDNNGIGGEQLVDMAVKTLELYGESYRRNQLDSPDLALKIQSLIRLMGPNSKYYQANYQTFNSVHYTILVHLDRIIDAITKLLQEYKVPDSDQGFALLLITLTREYYGNHIWSQLHRAPKNAYGTAGYTVDDYKQRLDAINEAIGLATASEYQLTQRIGICNNPSEREHLRRQRNSLIVEATVCNIEAERLSSEYMGCCKAVRAAVDEACTNHQQPYALQFKKLEDVIRNDPLNGYAYNALFKLFRAEYEGGRWSDDEKVMHLTEVMAIVQDCKLLGSEITSRGDRRDELSDHILEISGYADTIPVTIDTIEQQSELEDSGASTFMEIYQKFLEEGIPAAILFVCRKEIQDALESAERLGEAARLRCRKVLSFMKEPTRLRCIYTDSNAIDMLIRVAWMAYSGTQLTITTQCQTPGLAMEHWRELHKYCERYAHAVTEGGQRPIVMLLYALCVIQVGNKTRDSYERAYHIIRTINEERFGKQYRMRTPFMVTDEHGKPDLYTGTVRHTKDRYGYMDVVGLPSSLGNTDGIHFSYANLGRNVDMPAEGRVFGELEVGIGYMGFTLYREEGRKVRRRSK